MDFDSWRRKIRLFTSYRIGRFELVFAGSCKSGGLLGADEHNLAAKKALRNTVRDYLAVTDVWNRPGRTVVIDPALEETSSGLGFQFRTDKLRSSPRKARGCFEVGLRTMEMKADGDRRANTPSRSATWPGKRSVPRQTDGSTATHRAPHQRIWYDQTNQPDEHLAKWVGSKQNPTLVVIQFSYSLAL